MQVGARIPTKYPSLQGHLVRPPIPQPKLETFLLIRHPLRQAALRTISESTSVAGRTEKKEKKESKQERKERNLQILCDGYICWSSEFVGGTPPIRSDASVDSLEGRSSLIQFVAHCFQDLIVRWTVRFAVVAHFCSWDFVTGGW